VSVSRSANQGRRGRESRILQVGPDPDLNGVADGRPVGYLLPVDAPNRPGVHVAELVVDPDYRREGRARGLLAAVIADADGSVTLQAHPDNDAALSLYEEMGFEVVDRRTDAYADGDALVLRRK
jgi:ribosomal protein S18 acetylase RimI-like enzyme